MGINSVCADILYIILSILCRKGMTASKQDSGWQMLILVSCLSYGYAMCRHVLVSVQDPLIDYFQLNAVEYNLLQSLYSWPNSVCCAILGILLDKIGLNTMIFGCFISSWIGLILMAISPNLDWFGFDNQYEAGYILLCISRTIVGSTNEAMRTSLRILVLNNFPLDRYGIAIGIFEGIILIWSALNNVVMLEIYVVFDSIPNTLLMPAIIYPTVSIPLLTYLLYQICCVNRDHDQHQEYNDGDELKEVEFTVLSSEMETSRLISTAENDNIPKKFHLADIKSFGLIHWSLFLAGGTFGTALTSFMNIQISFFYHTYGYEYSLATQLGMIGSIAAIISMVLFGYITDKYGHKCKLILLSCLLASTAHYLYGWVHINLVVTILSVIIFNVALGIGSCVLTTAVALVVDANKLGTGYGIYYSLLFTSNAIGYIIVGLLTIDEEHEEDDEDIKEYRNVSYFLMLLPAVSATCICIVWYLDVTSGKHKLERIKK